MNIVMVFFIIIIFLKYVPCSSLMIGFFWNQMLKKILGKIGNKNSADTVT